MVFTVMIRMNLPLWTAVCFEPSWHDSKHKTNNLKVFLKVILNASVHAVDSINLSLNQSVNQSVYLNRKITIKHGPNTLYRKKRLLSILRLFTELCMVLQPCRHRTPNLLCHPSTGGNGYINDYPMGRFLRDAKLYEIGAGTSEIRRLIIGRSFNAMYK